MSEFASTLGHVPLANIRVDEQLWGEGAEARVLDWLATQYKQGMPRLAVATIPEKDNGEAHWLLGWEHEGTAYEPLLTTIFGEEYAADKLLGQAQDIVLCPRCNLSFFTPLGTPLVRPELAPYPALSRLTRGVPEEERIYVCAWCGSDEAHEEWNGKLTPASEWPVFRPGPFGQGRTP